MSENQKRLLQQALDMLEEQALHIEAPMLPAGEELLNRIRAAISQQAEPFCAACEGRPAPCNDPCALCGKQAEATTVQCPICDSHKVAELRTKHCLSCDADFAGADEMSANKQAVLAARAKRVAQAEQQPAAEPAPAQDERAIRLLAELSRAPQEGEKVSRDRMSAIIEVGHDRAAFIARLARPAQSEQQVLINARRYETLRAMHWNDGPLAVVRNPKQQVKLGTDCPSGERLDQMLDEIDEQRYPR